MKSKGWMDDMARIRELNSDVAYMVEELNAMAAGEKPALDGATVLPVGEVQLHSIRKELEAEYELHNPFGPALTHSIASAVNGYNQGERR